MELPFSYSFFDTDYNKLYQNEKQTKDMMIIFSILAIFIACLGLLGLASFSAVQKTKEIGIRKTMGATNRNIIWSFSKTFTKWVLFASFIAWPLAWLAMNRWLQNFEYRVSMSWWIFYRSYPKKVFWPNLCVGSSFQPLDILKYACGLKLGPALSLNQNPIF